MIWHYEAVKVIDQPSNVSVVICGMMNESDTDKDIIQILVKLLSDNGVDKTIVAYTHNPVMMRAEQPSAEDVLDRYQAKVNKIRSTLLTTDYLSLFRK